MTLYTITDWLGIVPIFICLCFGVMGLVQLIERRSLLKERVYYDKKRTDKDISCKSGTDGKVYRFGDG